MINVNDTVRSYSGKKGCMCGCNGSYNEGERARKLALTHILKQDFQVENFNTTDKDGTRGCIYVESETRNRVLYLTEAGVEAALELAQAKALA